MNHYTAQTGITIDPAFKATGWYLDCLPSLEPTDKLTAPELGTAAHKEWSAVRRAPPGPDRWKLRSCTFPGMAEAAARQWGGKHSTRRRFGMADDDEPHRLVLDIPCLCASCRSEAMVGVAAMIERAAKENDEEGAGSPTGIMILALCKAAVRADLSRDALTSFVAETHECAEDIREDERRRMN
ncbi:hypothetical protein C2I36_09585 [Rhodobacteraceae bacterium WD3A24]|nr:hypothetical protein C2I36_09585 [Rhodobacteraceae bacterium WD3A24]